MTFNLLISAVEADAKALLDTMNVTGDAVLVNQCDNDEKSLIKRGAGTVKVINQNKRGVGVSRNEALLSSDADICLFSDEDIVYDAGYEEKVKNAFLRLEDASVIAFNIRVDERRRTYYNEDEHRIRWYNYGRYPAYAIAVRRDAIIKNNIRYSKLFGGGARYSNGEDSLFLHDCLKARLKMYAVTDELGAETYRESTWFKGYNDKFFFDRGVLYHFLYGYLAPLFGLRFLFSNRKEMLKDIKPAYAYKLLLAGVKEGKAI